MGMDPSYLFVSRDQDLAHYRSKCAALTTENLALKKELMTLRDAQTIANDEGFKRMSSANKQLYVKLNQKEKQVSKVQVQADKLKGQLQDAKKELSARALERRNFLRNKRGRETKMEWLRARRKWKGQIIRELVNQNKLHPDVLKKPRIYYPPYIGKKYVDAEGNQLPRPKPFANWNGVRGAGAGKVAKDIRDLPVNRDETDAAVASISSAAGAAATELTLNEELNSTGSNISERLSRALKNAIKKMETMQSSPKKAPEKKAATNKGRKTSKKKRKEEDEAAVAADAAAAGVAAETIVHYVYDEDDELKLRQIRRASSNDDVEEIIAYSYDPNVYQTTEGYIPIDQQQHIVLTTAEDGSIQQQIVQPVQHVVAAAAVPAATDGQDCFVGNASNFRRKSGKTTLMCWCHSASTTSMSPMACIKLKLNKTT